MTPYMLSTSARRATALELCIYGTSQYSVCGQSCTSGLQQISANTSAVLNAELYVSEAHHCVHWWHVPVLHCAGLASRQPNQSSPVHLILLVVFPERLAKCSLCALVT